MTAMLTQLLGRMENHYPYSKQKKSLKLEKRRMLDENELVWDLIISLWLGTA